MERLTKETLNGLMDMAYNHVFIKDGEAWYRDFEREVSARDFAKEMFARNGIEYPDEMGNFDEYMLDLLQDGYETIDGMIAMYYMSLWSMADVRENLKAYEDTGLTPEEIVKINTFEKTQTAKLLDENCKLKRELEQWKRESISDKAKLGEIRLWLEPIGVTIEEALEEVKK